MDLLVLGADRVRHVRSEPLHLVASTREQGNQLRRRCRRCAYCQVRGRDPCGGRPAAPRPPPRDRHQFSRRRILILVRFALNRVARTEQKMRRRIIGTDLVKVEIGVENKKQRLLLAAAIF